MKFIKTALILAIFITINVGCSEDYEKKKGFQVKEIMEDEEGRKVVGLALDSLDFKTRPRNVLLTHDPKHRLTPIYKVNYRKKDGKPYTGSNAFHRTWQNAEIKGNRWNQHIIPGFEAVYGYNFVNVSHYNLDSAKQNYFFEKPVLIKTLYYPSLSKDTLNYHPVERRFYMVSVFDEDSNEDGFINHFDLRRFYLFDLEGNKQKVLIPKTYSVTSSEYDFENDLIYVFAQFDENSNGKAEAEEPIHVFWIDMKNPQRGGVEYEY